jgi:hypothetical protein
MCRRILSEEEKSYLLECYFKVCENKTVSNKYLDVITKYKEKFDLTPPSKSTIYEIVAKYRKYHSIENRYKDNRKKTVVTDENAIKVENCILSGQAVSIRQINVLTDINRESVRRILKNKLKMFPYKIQIEVK